MIAHGGDILVKNKEIGVTFEIFLSTNISKENDGLITEHNINKEPEGSNNNSMWNVREKDQKTNVEPEGFNNNSRMWNVREKWQKTSKNPKGSTPERIKKYVNLHPNILSHRIFYKT